MEEKVGYQPEESLTLVGDWRWQEAVNMASDAIMDELLGLSEEIHDSKLLHEEAKAELREAQERLKLMEAQVLQAALDSKDTGVSDQVKGKNAEERKRKADIYLADHLTVKQLAFEVKPLESLEAAARVAMETLLERSKNLHQWAKMFEAQVKLLSTVRMPELTALQRDGMEVLDKLVVALEEDVLTVMTAGGVEIPYIGEEPEPDGARFVSEVDELFPPDVEIPPSMDVPEEKVDDLKAAVERYQDIGEKADGSLGPSL